MSQLRSRSETAQPGVVAWRLINMLSLNHLGLVERGAGRNGQALREMLSMFADMSDARSSEAHPRRAQRRQPARRAAHPRSGAGVGAARGIEITVTLDEKAFEGSGRLPARRRAGAVLRRICGVNISPRR